ncbi:MAG: glutathione-dependent formaldehyde dehydrogenase [Chloroflexi bacterium]|jgi:threonine dehydrogenase-like Zn-dependent dehydrogenase|nr:glutathione-dependent formaldehyde dehydrogenase [Chloroflexota bacterium]
MKAVCWHGRSDVRVEDVPEPILLNPRDAIVQVTLTAICGSDLHLYDGFVPTMVPGDILGHEFVGRVVEVGSEVKRLQPGDRVVVPFAISCGACSFCESEQWSLCDNSNPNAAIAETLYGYSPAGIYGYSHAFGGYAGGQAEYVRVPYADVGPIRVPDELSDEQAITLADIFPTGYMAAEQANIQPGDVVAVWGCGPVGQMAIKSAYLLGAERVIAIDRIKERLQMARDQAGAEVINREGRDVVETLKQMTAGRGPDVCIDAVGMEAHVGSVLAVVDRIKQAARIETGRPVALREAIQACRKGGVVSLAGVYGGFLDTIPFGAAFNKGLSLKMGQTHVQRYLRPLLERIQRGEIDPSFVITHRLPMEDAPYGYRLFREKADGCVKVVLEPDHNGGAMAQ